jgi:hypothetical protein
LNQSMMLVGYPAQSSPSVIASSVCWAVAAWAKYLALEPFVRKRWPGRIISWARLLAGDFRDPLVGRDVLIGALFGIGMTLWQLFFFLGRGRFGNSIPRPTFEPSILNLGIGSFVDSFVGQLSSPLLYGFQFLFVVLLLALLFRRDWLGFIVGWVVFSSALALLGGGAIVNWVGASVTAGLTTLVLFRYGLLAMLASIYYLQMYIVFPVTTQVTAPGSACQ